MPARLGGIRNTERMLYHALTHRMGRVPHPSAFTAYPLLAQGRPPRWHLLAPCLLTSSMFTDPKPKAPGYI